MDPYMYISATLMHMNGLLEKWINWIPSKKSVQNIDKNIDKIVHDIGKIVHDIGKILLPAGPIRFHRHTVSQNEPLQ